MKNQALITTIVILSLWILSINLLSTHAQSDVRIISGFYSNSNASLAIIFPSNWTGLEGRSDSGYVALVSPDGYETIGEQPPSPYLTIDIIDKSHVPSLEPSFGPSARESFPCETILEQVKINDMDAIKVAVPECNIESNTSFKSTQYAFQTDQNFIILTFRGNPPSDYDRYLEDFEKSVGTLKIANTIEAPVVPEFPEGLIAVVVISGMIAIIATSASKNLHRLPF